jgi:hypothetical protein
VFDGSSVTNRLNYKHVKIINYPSSGVSKLKASLNDDARVVIYDHHIYEKMFVTAKEIS